MRLRDAELSRLLEAWPVARLATVAPDGRPHVVPVVFARHAGALWSPVDGKPKRGAALARIRNAAHEPRVALLLDHYEADWTRLFWIRVDGVASVVGADAGAESALLAKYPQYRTTPLYAGAPALVRIEIARISSWRASEAPIDPAGGALG
jgi:PPOX class probable F420-dependent enzyme